MSIIDLYVLLDIFTKFGFEFGRVLDNYSRLSYK